MSYELSKISRALESSGACFVSVYISAGHRRYVSCAVFQPNYVWQNKSDAHYLSRRFFSRVLEVVLMGDK